jgi:hypothetical protein
MTTSLTLKDYLLISSYLDGQLSASEIAEVDKRVQVDADFKQTLRELKYTKRMLSSLPEVKAPRNFLLTPEKVKKTSRRQWFQPAWGMVSALSTLVLLVVFISTRMNFSMGAMSAAPEKAVADNYVAMESAAVDSTPTPMIILWNPPRAFGMGGGGDGNTYATSGEKLYPEMTAIAVTPPLAVLPPTEMPALAEPTATAPSARDLSPAEQATSSSLILGIPDEDARGKMITSDSQEVTPRAPVLPVSTWLMISAGIAAIASLLIAILTRRR